MSGKPKWNAERAGWKRVFIYLPDALYDELKELSKIAEEGKGNLSHYTRSVIREHVLKERKKKV